MDRRNLAIIAHVDHGKTTLVDRLLAQSGTFRAHEKIAERVMDSNDQERERGITILAKCTSVVWKDIRLNIVDTPGHADFGGEVERILGMVDGVCLLVDAAEGPMPQTKFVLGKALRLGLRPIVVINKVDRPDARAHEVHDLVFDLFANLGANDDQLDFPTVFASAKQGWATLDLDAPQPETMAALFDKIVDHIPRPNLDPDAPFAMLPTMLDSDPFLGRILTGRVEQGRATVNQAVKSLSRDGSLLEQGRLTKLLAYRGIERVPVDEVEAGDIIAIAGLVKTSVADTICAQEVTTPLESQPIDPPTLSMTFTVNDSPLAGRDGDKVTSRLIRARLEKEVEVNVAIRVTESEGKDAFEVAGRGELQLGVLIESMRREGFELSVGRPRVVYKTDPATGQRLEPIEEVVIDVDDEYTGVVVEKLGQRKGEMVEMKPTGEGKTRIVFYIPSRGMIGYQGEFLTDTRGTGVLARLFHEYAPYKGALPERRNGVLISNADGVATAYALWNLEDRGVMFIDAGAQIYTGMIIGEHSRDNDLDVNPMKAKQLTNIRAAGKDESIRLTPPRIPTLEQAIGYIADDEVVEVTPKVIRLRKKLLDANDRKRSSKRDVE